ncbi:hypothetical protein [Heyndrickxia oleronia]|jgi:hypothetical protein|uniref:hypothetical protein n=1 Tax=Heyndrickxia oleronia TaxID=38875 RepID=UPI002431B968|nr:hypothetical protein [Heyndrickxia oleronia]MCI1590735.1 hypothetical protein [Heyndrickxia oleronia]MCI1612076.1 hypothetical protein [Heyndrickxia oleronia]MCI1759785.1 hypothetical protein [Heyndrickxia oleronia]
MKQSFDDELNVSFKKFNQSFRMKPEYHAQLRERILFESKTVKKKSSNKKIWILAAATVLVLLGSSPLYSSTMASLAAKIIPLEIRGSDTSNANPLHSKISQIIEDSGYGISSIGTTPNPFTIHIALQKGEASLPSMKEVLVPKMEKLLSDQGIDQYKLDITQVDDSEKKLNKHIKSSKLMDEVGVIISDEFTAYGYSDLAPHATYGINEGWIFSNTLEIDMPDDVKKAEDIKNFVIKSIDKEGLDIKKVKLNYYNKKHRDQEDRWAYIVNDVYQALQGNSTYNVTGISYKVEKGVTYVWIKTAMSDGPDKQIISDIKTALHTYLASEEIKGKIQRDQYEIQLLSEDKNILLQVSSTSKEKK